MGLGAQTIVQPDVFGGTEESGGSRQGIQPNSFPCWWHTLLLVQFSDFCLLSVIGIILNAVPEQKLPTNTVKYSNSYQLCVVSKHGYIYSLNKHVFST